MLSRHPLPWAALALVAAVAHLVNAWVHADEYILLSLGFSATALHLAGVAYRHAPYRFWQQVLRIVARVFYRVDLCGRQAIPATGGVVLSGNHITLIDWLFVIATTDRPVRFVMQASYMRLPILGRLFRDCGVIPIAQKRDNPGVLAAAMEEVAQALERGEAVCIFPEGTLTRDGYLNPFRRGVERIIARTPVPVVPFAMRGLYGSIWGRSSGKRLSLRRRRVMFIRLPLIAADQVSAMKLREVIEPLCETPRFSGSQSAGYAKVRSTPRSAAQSSSGIG